MEKTRRTNTRGDTPLNRFESWKLRAMKSRLAIVERNKRANITFNRFILKLRFTAKPPPGNRGKSIYPHSHLPPSHIYDDAVLALVYQTIVDNVDDAVLHI